MAIVGSLELSKSETKEVPLWWQKQGLSFTASGYGGKIPTSRMVKVDGRWRRVYVACYSNLGTAYIVKGKDWITVSD